VSYKLKNEPICYITPCLGWLLLDTSIDVMQFIPMLHFNSLW